MTIFDIINSAEFVTADDRQVVQLDRAVWEELVTWLEHLKELNKDEVVSLKQVKTPLGHQLKTARAKIIADGEPLLDWTGLEQEIADRRGGQE
jgi:hypothetical protein